MASRTALAGALALVLLVAGAFGAVQPTLGTAGQTQADGNTTITVGSTAEVSAPADRAIVSVAVVTQAPTADGARAQLAANVSSVRDALRNASLSADQIRTTGFSIRPVFESTDEGRELVGYRAVQGFEVESAPDRAGSVIDTAVANGANQVEGVAFTLSEETRRELRTRALRQAVETARADAEILANASGLRITGVESVATRDVQFQPFQVRTDTADPEGAGTVVDPGPVRVFASVDVVYRAV